MTPSASILKHSWTSFAISPPTSDRRPVMRLHAITAWGRSLRFRMLRLEADFSSTISMAAVVRAIDTIDDDTELGVARAMSTSKERFIKLLRAALKFEKW
jgi:hypothetical protein